MKKTGAKILVNAITMSRAIGTFLMPFVSVAYNAEQLISYIIILFLTDSIDGIMARRLKVSTLFGALLDTLADKLLSIATLIVLARVYPIMWVPIILELLITIINVTSGTKGGVTGSTMLGKAKTWVLGVCTVLGFITVFATDLVNLIDNSSTIGLSLINMFKYISKNSKIIMTILALISSITSTVVAINYFIKNKLELIENKRSGFYTKKYKLKTGIELKEALFSTEFYERTKGESMYLILGKVVD